MSRKRLSWNKKADPYKMNQEREQPAHDKYQAGDPSAWAEDVHQPLPDDPALGRNEIGQPNMSESNLTHKDVNEWNSDDAYDNAYTFDGGDRNRSASQQREASRDVYAHLERKAFQCVKIADALFPGAPESLIEAQAFDFMSLPDEVVISTIVRLADADEEEKEDDAKEDAKEDEEEKGKKKASSFDEDRIEAMLREMLAEDDEVEDEDDEDEEDDDDDEVEAMLREMLSEQDEDEDDEDDEDEDDEDDEDDDDEDEDKEAGTPMDMGTHSEEDPEIEAMIAEMMDADEHLEDHDDMDMDGYAPTDMDIELEPTMDTVGASIAEDDSVLANLFSGTVPKEAQTKAPQQESTQGQRQASGSKGVQSLGGRVKAASDGGRDDVDLSKLWQSDPDVSDVF